MATVNYNVLKKHCNLLQNKLRVCEQGRERLILVLRDVVANAPASGWRDPNAPDRARALLTALDAQTGGEKK